MGLGEGLVEGERERVLDAVDGTLRRDLAAVLLRRRSTRVSEQRFPIGAAGLDRHLAQSPKRCLLRNHALGELDGLAEQIALDYRVDDAELCRLRRAHGIARDDHLERGFEAGDPRQALDAAGAGDDADLDLGQAHLCARRRDPEMTAERHLEPAAERHAVDGSHHRLRARLQRRDGDAEARRLRWLAEFADVGARDEGPALADDDHGRDTGIGNGALDAVDHALAHCLAQRIHRRVIDRENGDGALLRIGNAHVRPPSGDDLRRTIRARPVAFGCGRDSR